MRKAVFGLASLTCPSCRKKIEDALTGWAGMGSVTVFFHLEKVRVEFDENITTAEEIERVIASLGYPIIGTKIA